MRTTELAARLDGWASRVDPELREELLAELERVAG
jgi:uncharacterized lipoprotein YmbA